MSAAIVCRTGCCPGCQNCYGYRIGCHQVPCRCDLPCTCTDDDDGSYIVGDCIRHDESADTRWPEPDDDLFASTASPCAECGASGACAYDDEGRPLVHPIAADGDD